MLMAGLLYFAPKWNTLLTIQYRLSNRAPSQNSPGDQEVGSSKNHSRPSSSISLCRKSGILFEFVAGGSRICKVSMAAGRYQQNRRLLRIACLHVSSPSLRHCLSSFALFFAPVTIAIRK